MFFITDSLRERGNDSLNWSLFLQKNRKRMQFSAALAASRYTMFKILHLFSQIANINVTMKLDDFQL